MNTVFLDTVGLLALWDTRDQWHNAAERAFAQHVTPGTEMLTTAFVLLECANAAARRPYRSDVVRLRQELEAGGLVVHPTQEDWDEAWNAYARGAAGQPGVVDHVSFIVMQRLGVEKAFTNDRHFQAAGFQTLF